MEYNRNINVKNYASVEAIFDSVNNDPKRPGFQVIYLDKARGTRNAVQAWLRYLHNNGYSDDKITEKHPKLNGEEYTALIIRATPEQALALKLCF